LTVPLINLLTFLFNSAIKYRRARNKKI